MDKPLSVFISYSHRDEGMCEELITHLSSMRRDGLISHWHDRKLLPGDDWGKNIDNNLVNAQVILLLVSSDFIASDYCYEVEMKTAIEKHSNMEAVVIPIILRSCDWKHTLFGKIQGLPKDGKPVTMWDDRDLAYLNIVEGIRAKISDLLNSTKAQVTSKKAETKKAIFTNDLQSNVLKKMAKPTVVASASEEDDINQQYDELIEHLEETGTAFNSLHDFVSSTIYHYSRRNDFYPEYADEDIRRDVRKFEGLGQLREDEGYITPNTDDPAVETAVNAITELGKFIDDCCSEVYDRFKKEYNIALDINSTRLWKEFFHVRVST
ncbi:toll/interleukin-1 receptor domain-containing protein [Paenibacillus sp. BSR1-1]|uniref:toll/interleukin-1 receptor domain-containing protein n=1 Tax=Paenibacillus sp. BSR1-1 TaxID=3020845 RepID=UPI0025B095B3|nr:toll/interleukin-1 receptor domain-containing protein [Paenibacillus sp. BSR1-1]MDN3017179.1 toll/interleukin-1 receptor domain-containing protein [Paenibacillus sp. BSR1-1]